MLEQAARPGPEGWSIRAARAEDLPQIRGVLERSGLITAGVEEHLAGFLVAVGDGRLAGLAGVEVYGDAALLRSVAVEETVRGRGLGRRLVREVLARAARREIREVALLTTSAAPFFRALGFQETDRAALDPRLAASAELSDANCATATAMVQRLR